jgi:hypothetical protein
VQLVPVDVHGERYRAAPTRPAVSAARYSEPFPMALGVSTTDRISLLGQDLADDIMGTVGFGDLAFWLAARRRPTPGETRLSPLTNRDPRPTTPEEEPVHARITIVTAQGDELDRWQETITKQIAPRITDPDTRPDGLVRGTWLLDRPGVSHFWSHELTQDDLGHTFLLVKRGGPPGDRTPNPRIKRRPEREPSGLYQPLCPRRGSLGRLVTAPCDYVSPHEWPHAACAALCALAPATVDGRRSANVSSTYRARGPSFTASPTGACPRHPCRVQRRFCRSAWPGRRRRSAGDRPQLQVVATGPLPATFA